MKRGDPMPAVITVSTAADPQAVVGAIRRYWRVSRARREKREATARRARVRRNWHKEWA